jgi:hypothetical protein
MKGINPYAPSANLSENLISATPPVPETTSINWWVVLAICIFVGIVLDVLRAAIF